MSPRTPGKREGEERASGSVASIAYAGPHPHRARRSYQRVSCPVVLAHLGGPYTQVIACSHAE